MSSPTFRKSLRNIVAGFLGILMLAAVQRPAFADFYTPDQAATEAAGNSGYGMFYNGDTSAGTQWCWAYVALYRPYQKLLCGWHTYMRDNTSERRFTVIESADCGSVDWTKYTRVGGLKLVYEVGEESGLIEQRDSCDAPSQGYKAHYVNAEYYYWTYRPCVDRDGDGYTACGGDCNDNDPAVNPGVAEICDDGIDNNCDGQIDENCPTCPTIESFTASSTIISPVAGGTITFVPGIEGSYDSYEITIDGKEKIAGDRWDGKIGDTVIDPGEHVATLTVKKAGCDDATRNLKITAAAVEGACALMVTFGSSANVASGGLTHSQALFFGKGAGLGTSMSLYYNSVDPYDGPLGRGWTHDYSISVTENADGSVLVREPNGVRRLYKASGGSYTSPVGDYSILEKNSDNTFTLTHKDGTAYHFNASGNIASIVDRNGNAMTFGYTGGNLASITDPAGRVTTLAYGGDKLTSITDSAGNAWLLTVSGDALTGVTQPDGGQWTYAYDADGFMLTKTDPMGYTTTYAYDAEHRVISATDPEGKTRSITYPAADDSGSIKTTTFTEKDGGVWSYVYDTENGTLTRKTDPDGNATSYIYDASGNMLTKTEPDGGVSSYSYDAQGNMASTTDALGKTTSYAYNGFGQVTSVTASDGTITSYEYDAFGNLIAVTDPAGATTRYEYDSKGNVIKTTNANGQSTVFGYDQQNNLVSVTDATGAITRLAYDSAGNITSVNDPLGAITRFEYDNLGRLIKVTDPLGNVTGYGYDAAGNKTSVTDANGNVTRYEYNYKGQIIKTTDALGHVTTYTYGSTGCGSCGGGVDKLTTLTDANGHSTSFEYDRLGRVIKETDPIGNFSTYAYDAGGKLTAKTDANGNTVSYDYDALGRLLKKSYPDGSGTSFGYDAKGNLASATNPYIAYSFAYDANSRVTGVTDSRGLTVQYQYDNLGNRAKLITPENRTVSYGYDAANRLNGIISGNERFSFGYDTLGRRISLAYSNGVTTSYAYDKDSRLTGIATRSSRGEILDSYTYTHDKVGNRLSKTEPDTKSSYSYDAVYKLLQSLPTKLHGKDKEQEHKAENYAYDPVGNRLTGPKPKDAAFYNQGNHLVNDRKHQYEYDKNGNLIKKTEIDDDGITKVWTYGYDFENRLIKVEIRKSSKTRVVTFTYDPFGRRLSKTVHREEIEDADDDKDDEEKDCPRTTYYVYDNEDIILEYNQKGKVTARYLHGPGIDEPLAVEKKHGRYYYHADGLGSITAMTDNKGKVAQRYDYDSFGNLKHHGNRVKQPYTYTGREWDKETGLYYYRARYYEPKAGRFISKDPIGFAGGDVNLYGYVGNNPLNTVDPLGLDPRIPGSGSIKPNPVTRCHVNPHNDPRENAIGALLIGGPLLIAAAPEVIAAGQAVQQVAQPYIYQYGPQIAATVKATDDIVQGLMPGPPAPSPLSYGVSGANYLYERIFGK